MNGTAHTMQQVGCNRFCPRDTSHEIKSIWFHAACRGDNFLSPRQGLDLWHTMKFDPATCPCNMSLRFVAPCDRTLTIIAHYSWRHKDSPEFTRPCFLRGTMYSRNLGLCLSVGQERCRISWGISQSASHFWKWGVSSNNILCCTRMFLLHQGFLQACTVFLDANDFYCSLEAWKKKILLLLLICLVRTN